MRILDMSAGNRAVWIDKKNPLATFLDLRAEVNPDIVCDTRTMSKIVKGKFDLFVFDPPHLYQNHADSAKGLALFGEVIKEAQ